MLEIKDRFIQGADECFVNTDKKDFSQLVIISELALYDVEKYVKSLKEENIDEENLKHILAQVVIALDVLHNDLKICHRDLKPANILIYPGMKIKLADFGFFKEIDRSNISMSKCGTPMFTPPEILGIVDGEILPFKIDTYSLGLTACWIINKSAPFYKEIKKRAINFSDIYS